VKKSILGLIVLSVLFMSCTMVNPTEVGFKISKSGDYRGIDSLPTVTGWNFYFPFTSSIITIPTTQQHVVWTKNAQEGTAGNEEISVSCQGGAGFNMDIGFNYRVDGFKAAKIYLKYKTDDLQKITNSYLRNVVRGAMQDLSGTMTVDSVLNNLPAYEHQVAATLRAELAPQGFIVDNFNITSQPRPSDDNLAKAIAAKITAKQNAETSKMELQQSIAEANKLIATAKGDSASKVINALADAEVIKVKTQSLSSSPQYIDLIKAEKWNGALPTIVAGSQGMFLNIKQ
jgi:regulator of protease activity HflC (stomatin/prohibitin superfamily)